MPISRRAVLALTLAAVAATSVHAQSWPNKPIRMIVPFTPGGGTDLIARELAQTLTVGSGYNFVVENRPGMGGSLGVGEAAKAPADGYAFVLAQTSNLSVNPTLYPKLSYDPEKDLTPVALVATAGLAIVTGTDSRFKTMAEVVAAAKASPETITYATSGNGTVSHLAMEAFQRAVGVKMIHVPYKGAAQGTTDVIGGRVDLYVSSIPTLVGHVRNGKMRALAVTSAKRSNDLPQVPTIAEAAVPGFEAATWFGIVGPANLPKEVVAKFNADIGKALKNPALQKKLEEQGADVTFSTPERFSALIKDETARWGKVIKESGAKLD
jgi:tripartite-type tricarboxylate transporter receptor subunit TctC